MVLVSLMLGCASTTPGTIVVPETPLPAPSFSNPPPLVLERIQWQVLNAKDIQDLLVQKKDIALFALTGDDYAKLLTNMEKIKHYIAELQIATQAYVDIIQARTRVAETAQNSKTEEVGSSISNKPPSSGVFDLLRILF